MGVFWDPDDPICGRKFTQTKPFIFVAIVALRTEPYSDFVALRKYNFLCNGRLA